MFNQAFKDQLDRTVLPRVQNPIAYVGGELNSVRKDHRTVAGRLCLAFPDLYTIGMSNQGLQVLYTLMNQRPDWACERAYAPMMDMEQTLRSEGLPLYSLETFTPLGEFDVLGFSLQYEISYVDILTMLDLGEHSAAQRRAHAGRSADDRRRPLRAEPGTDRAVHRCVHHGRRRAVVAGRLRSLA